MHGSPFQLPLCQQWRILDRHISSSIRTRGGTWQGIDRMHRGLSQLLVGWSFGLDLPRESQLHGRASPSSRSYQGSRAARKDIRMAHGLQV